MTPQEHKQMEWARMDKSKEINGRGLDNIIFVIGTGLFVLSIDFILGSKGAPLQHRWLIVCSWVALVISIISHAVSYFFAIKASDYVQTKLNEWESHGFPQPFNLNSDPENTRIKECVVRANYISYTGLFVGIVLLLIFASINLYCI